MKKLLDEYLKFMNLNTPQKKTLVGLFFVVIIGFLLIDNTTVNKVKVVVSGIVIIAISVGIFFMERKK